MLVVVMCKTSATGWLTWIRRILCASSAEKVATMSYEESFPAADPKYSDMLRMFLVLCGAADARCEVASKQVGVINLLSD